MTAWALHTNPDGDRSLWHGDTEVARPGDLRVAHGYQQPLFDLLAAVLVQPPDVVTALADALHRWNTPTDPHFVIHGRTHPLDGEIEGDSYLPIARAALAALAMLHSGGEVTPGAYPLPYDSTPCPVPPPPQDAVGHVAHAMRRLEHIHDHVAEEVDEQ